MSDNGVGTGGGGSATLGAWLSRVGPAAVLIPLAFVTLRVMRVAHGNYTTELALINDGKALTVLVGSLAPVAPYFVMYVAIFTALQARGLLQTDHPGNRVDGGPPPRLTADDLNARFVYIAVGLVAVAVVACTVSLGTLAFAAGAVVVFLVGITAVYFLILRLSHHPDIKGVFGRREWVPVVLTAGLLAFLVFQLGLDDSMWQPPVVVKEPAGWTTVYLLDTSDGGALAMDERSRTLVRLDTGVVDTAHTCYEHHGSLGNEYRLSRLPSVFQLVGLETHVNQVTCPEVIAQLTAHK